MHNYCTTLGTLAAVSALGLGNALAGTDAEAQVNAGTRVEYELHTGYSNEYLFHGVKLGQDLIEIGADVKAEVSGIALSASAWYGSFDNADLSGMNSGADVGELDLYGQIAKDFGICVTSVGYIYRYFESNEDLTAGTQDLRFSLSRQFQGVDFALTYFWSIEKAQELPLYYQGYTELAIGRNFEISKCLALYSGGKLGYLIEEGQLTAFTTKVSLDWGISQTAKLSPFVAYSIALNDDNNNASYASRNRLIGGLMLSVNF